MRLSKYSGGQVNRAGKALLANDVSDANLKILAWWRASHEEPLDQALDVLMQVASSKDKHAVYAKRLKRFASIVSKLQIYKKMKLKDMNDMGGCRVVVGNEKKLRQVVRELKNLSYFHFEPKGTRYREKDHIKKPPSSGYRGFHLIGQFPDKDNNLRKIEVQLRTRIQHYWATTVEIVDLFTDQALKSNQGQEKWTQFFSETATQFEAMQSIHLFEGLESKISKLNADSDALTKSLDLATSQIEVKKLSKKLEAVKTKIDVTKKSKALAKTNYYNLMAENTELEASRKKARKLSKALKVLTKLRAFSKSIEIIEGRFDSEKAYSGYVLLKIDTEKKTVSAELFREEESKSAEEEYTKAERASTDKEVIALVSSGAVDNLKEAYPNYYADSSEFVALLKLIEK